ncbi:hypothetical protein H3C67_00895 [Candidatus Dojkabacteria bacterium]|uniref:Uncharacterized protein n=1 Tax=Candidatus Dojkabacteria bacterium TaxID=2099670 RepID=A0A952AJT7_9BACT|nr:hypothetical protein [Candidatus Dojkabacteria bacterium]
MKNAKKILILIGNQINPDIYLSLHLLADAGKSIFGKDIEYAGARNVSETYKEVLPMPEINYLSSIPPKSFVLEFKNQKNKVENVQWSQEEDKLTLFLTMQAGDMNPANFNLKIHGANHDLVLVVGASRPEELGEFYAQAEQLFSEAEIVVFSTNPDCKFSRAKTYQPGSTSSVSEQVLIYLENQGVRINEVRATRLLSGIFSATGRFKHNLSSALTYELAARLTKYGAKNDLATKLMEQLEGANSATTQQVPTIEKKGEDAFVSIPKQTANERK